MKSFKFFPFSGVLLLILLMGAFAEMPAQRRKAGASLPTLRYDTTLYGGMKWRNIGPFRGGRSAAVTGVPGKPLLFYFGSTGGGVWRTQDGGNTWENISDGYFGGSIGAVAVSEADPNVIFVGGGEKTVRGNVSYGYGMWKSVDAGKTWAASGLEHARHIPRVRIHPHNPDIVLAAVMGDLYQATEERGVYKSTDGGQSWKRVLFANADAGAIDLIYDPNNPRIVYASTWRIRRTPYSLSSGGEGSAIWKSTDGGDTWKEITMHKGLPKGPLGIIGLAVSPANSERVWALVEAKDGGVFRSDDAGETWVKLNDNRSLRQRAWYYTRIYADPKDENVVYVVNVSYHKSTDGGKTFTSSSAPHGDHHDMWIAPEDPQRMIMGDDGGAQISFDGGENWTTYYNQPTAQFYRVITDDHFPYRIYGAQQDNSTVRILHRTDGGYMGESDWESTAGGESAHLAVDPDDNDIVYGGSYGGYLTRVNHRSGERRAINVWPDNPMGYGAEGMKYRFQWNFPIFFSPHDGNKLYAASNHLHVSYDEGQSWELISPDLTTNDSSKLGPSGGPITKDNTGVEYYCTIFAACESPFEKDLLWTGSDDGLFHVSRDGGENWENVTPADMPAWMMFNSIDPDPFEEGACYVAGTRYKLGDYRPYLYHVSDYGQTWRKITDGIDPGHFTRVVRADPTREGLLYAGTETGMYLSFDDGASWQPFQLNLPIVPITDLALKDDNLIAATQGRSFWLIDDLTPLYQLNEEVAAADHFLFKPKDAYRMGGGPQRPSRTAGTNHPGGVITHFCLKAAVDSVPVKLTFLEEDGTLIREFSTAAKERSEKLEVKAGFNTFYWNLRYPDAKDFDGMILWWGMTAGPQAPPGTYKVRLTVGEASQEQSFELLKDPRVSASEADLQAQFAFLMQIRDKLSETHEAIIGIRKVREDMNRYKARFESDSTYRELLELSETIDEEITAIEKALYQTQNRSGQDPLNFPIKLNNKLAHLGSLSSVGDNSPTDQARAFYEEVTGKIDAELGKWESVKQAQLPQFNELFKKLSVDPIQVEEAAPSGD